MRKRLRYHDLKDGGVVNNRVTLANWIETQGFPPGQLTGPNTRTWDEEEVAAWIAARPVERKAAHPTTRPRGRPRKAHNEERERPLAPPADDARETADHSEHTA